MATYTPKTNEEIRQLALDAFKGNIFFATMIPDKDQDHLLPSVFMPIMFAGEELLKKLFELDAVPYEYFDKAGPRSVNGYPCFFSMYYLSGKDYDRVRSKLKEIKEVMENVD